MPVSTDDIKMVQALATFIKVKADCGAYDATDYDISNRDAMLDIKRTYEKIMVSAKEIVVLITEKV